MGSRRLNLIYRSGRNTAEKEKALLNKAVHLVHFCHVMVLSDIEKLENQPPPPRRGEIQGTRQKQDKHEFAENI